MSILYLPNYTPTSVNKLLSMHWGSRGKVKRGDMDIIAHFASVQKLPRATGRRKVTIRVVWPRGARMPDPDNIKKVLLDGFVAASLLVDDSIKWCQVEPIEYFRHAGEVREVFAIFEDI